ncbi:M48 family metallopeptidase [Alicycliphilus denitrificans]|uniref:M48 family metallopeptidase n=1 Tax=Alicycliphilus denitrificans TaxID=179636 RepID=UPI00384CF583
MAGWMQQVLDWLDAPQPDTVAPATVPRSRRLAPPAGESPQAGAFSHPQASRELLLDGVRVAYRLQRARRRSIGFIVGQDGLAVRAPAWVTLAAVDAALRDKSGWILRKLGEAQARQRQQQDARIAWGDGALLPYLGDTLALRIDPSQRRSGQCLADAQGRVQLYLGLPRDAQAAQVRDAAQAWFMRQARAHFTERLDHFAPRLGVQYRSLRLSSAATRWGSARSDGSIRLNWRLLHYRESVIDYVVAHELAHLRVMDHSPRFWDVVHSVVPDYAALRQQLRAQPAPPWD